MKPKEFYTQFSLRFSSGFSLELRFTAQHPRFSVYEVEDTFGGLGFMRRRTHVEVYYFLCTQALVVEAEGVLYRV